MSDFANSHCVNGSSNELQLGRNSVDEELLASGDNTNSPDPSIDEALGALEDLVFSPAFSALQDDFFDRHCDRFDDSDENPLYYTEIFNDYGKLLDEYLSKRIKEKLPAFKLDTFAAWLLAHEDEIAGDIVELIHSTTDFLHFKDLMLEQKKTKAKKKEVKEESDKDHGLAGATDEDIDLSQSLSIRSCRIHLQ